MTLARQTLLRSLLLALPAALLIFAGVEWLRGRERENALERVVNAHDPHWFLAGPRTGRPSAQDRLQPDADVRLPRPTTEELPFEIFAYDHEFSPTSPAGPRFPEEFKREMRASTATRFVKGAYTSRTGTGLQMAKQTGWTPGPCAILLFRLQPTSGRAVTRALLFAGLFAVCFTVAFLALWPTTERIRKLAEVTRASARQNYTGIAKVRGNDEISALGSTFNETAADIRQRIVDARDRGEALQRYVANVTEGVAGPLAVLEQRLADLERKARLPDDASGELRTALREAHHLSSRLQNLAAVAHLRTITDTSPRQPVELRPLVERVVATRAPLAHAAQVTVELAPPDGTATVAGDPTLIEQAVANVIDNAILYNRPGGKVRVELRGYEHGGRFSLRVIDNGPGVGDEEFAGLTANRRFRGDEAKTRRPGGRGLGLALAREVADRFGMQLDLRRPTSGGFEVEISTRPRA
jgi:signal transduction histidine kinase